MVKYIFLLAALYNSYMHDMFNCIAFLVLTCVDILFEIKDLLTKKEKENGNN